MLLSLPLFNSCSKAGENVQISCEEEKITDVLCCSKAEINVSESCGEDENMDNVLPEVCIS